MEIRFLDTSKPGARWFRQYYRQRPHLRSDIAFASFINAQNMIAINPYLGRIYDGLEEVREYSIQGTAFSILYTEAQDTIFVIDVRDSRGMRSAYAIKKYADELRRLLS